MSTSGSVRLGGSICLSRPRVQRDSKAAIAAATVACVFAVARLSEDRGRLQTGIRDEKPPGKRTEEQRILRQSVSDRRRPGARAPRAEASAGGADSADK